MLIWVVMLGVMLTSVFFFFGMRLQNQSLTQREILEKQSKEAYLESYAGYLKSRTAEELEGLATEGFTLDDDYDETDGINNDEVYDITGRVSQSASALEGFLDSGESRGYAVTAGSAFTIEWNNCAYGQEGDLLINQVMNHHIPRATATCSSTFSDATTWTAAAGVDTLALMAISGPLHYRITSQSGDPLEDVEFHLNLSIPFQFGRKIETEEVFTPPTP